MAKSQELDKAKAMQGIPPKIVTMSEELSCDLNPVEWNNRAQEMGDAQKAVEEAEERKKSITADLNADVKTAKLKLSKLARVVSTHRELRDVTVKITYDYEMGIVTKTRTDTNEEVSRREMTDNERQAELELTDANKFIESRHEESSNGMEQGTSSTETSEEEV